MNWPGCECEWSCAPVFRGQTIHVQLPQRNRYYIHLIAVACYSSVIVAIELSQIDSSWREHQLNITKSALSKAYTKIQVTSTPHQRSN